MSSFFSEMSKKKNQAKKPCKYYANVEMPKQPTTPISINQRICAYTYNVASYFRECSQKTFLCLIMEELRVAVYFSTLASATSFISHVPFEMRPCNTPSSDGDLFYTSLNLGRPYNSFDWCE
jgi:hypothetical protein